MMRFLLFTFCLIPFFASAQTTVTIVGTPEMEDAAIGDFTPTTNYKDHDNILANAGTNGGTPTLIRTLFKFDLDTLPANAVVTSATLDLYHRQTNLGFKHEGANRAIIQRVTGPWTESTVTWSNRPTVTAADEVFLTETTSPTENKLNIDVTEMTKADWANYPNNYGYQLKLETEAAFRRQTYSSMDNPDPTKRPRLTITYTVTSSVGADISNADVEVYPNPVGQGSEVYIKAYETGFTYTILSLDGKRVDTGSIEFGHSKLSTSNLSAGSYIINLVSLDGKNSTSRIINIQ